MGILDFFKFTPPADKKYKLFLSNYIKKENHILELFGDIGASGSLDAIKVDYEDFAKHFRAIQITLLSASVSTAIFKGYISKNVDNDFKNNIQNITLF